MRASRTHLRLAGTALTLAAILWVKEFFASPRPTFDYFGWFGGAVFSVILLSTLALPLSGRRNIALVLWPVVGLGALLMGREPDALITIVVLGALAFDAEKKAVRVAFATVALELATWSCVTSPSISFAIVVGTLGIAVLSIAYGMRPFAFRAGLAAVGLFVLAASTIPSWGQVDKSWLWGTSAPGPWGIGQGAIEGGLGHLLFAAILAALFVTQSKPAGSALAPAHDESGFFILAGLLAVTGAGATPISGMIAPALFTYATLWLAKPDPCPRRTTLWLGTSSAASVALLGALVFLGERLADQIVARKGYPERVTSPSEHLKRATIAMEDRFYFSHGGTDWPQLHRALRMNVRSASFEIGASTISMQAARYHYLGREKTVRRKIAEIFVARALERRFTKDQILALYFEDVYYGLGCYGIRAGAERYFHKRPEELTLAESALLAGLVPSPPQQPPFRSRLLLGRELALGRMGSRWPMQYSDEEIQKAASTPLTFPKGLLADDPLPRRS